MSRSASPKKLLAVVALMLPAALVQAITSPPAQAVSPDIVISQVYGAGGNADATYTHDFVELYNRGAAPVDLTGWSVQYASATGTGNFSANAPTALSGTLPPGEHYLVSLASGLNGDPLPVAADATGTSNLAAASGKVVAVRPGTTLGLACNGSSDPCDAGETARIADLVGYGSANFFETAAAPGLSVTTSGHRAGNGATDTDNNASDFTTGVPDPRNCAEACSPPPPTCDAHQIHDVQGNGNSTPLAGDCVIVQGIVTGDFNQAGGLGGFYIQGTTPDADPQTSEGIFVASASSSVAVGDLVAAEGTAAENFGETRIDGASIEVISTGNSLPAATSYDLPRPAGVTFEPVEGMRVTFPEALTATEHFQLGRFGEITVSADGRLMQPTDVGQPGAEAQALLDDAARRRLLIDDGSSIQNPATVPFLSPQALRIGDTATGITGVLGFGFGLFRLQPTAPITFTRVNDRPAAPAEVGGDVRVASFNTLNYFTTLTSENSDARGADTEAEFARQQIKEVAAITGLDADILGLMEVENNGAEAIGSLVTALNDATAPGTYDWISEPAINAPNEFGGEFGTDAIKVAVIYKPAVVTPVGAAETSTDEIFDRPPLIQTFEPVAGGESVTVVVNHFKSKGSCPGAGVDADQGDGQSCWNNRRVLQAQALDGVLDALAPVNPLIIGDLNSYTEEDPIHVLEDAGYTGLSELFVAEDDRYSFVFDGFSGELDHALAGADLLDNVTGTTIWHINTDEPLMLDYNLDFGRDPNLFEPNAYRTSDHDPLLVGLDLIPDNTDPTVDAGGPYAVSEGDSVTLTATGNDADGDELTYAWDLDNDGSFETSGLSVEFSAAGLEAPDSATVSVQVTDGHGATATDTATVDITWAFGGFTGQVAGPPAVNLVKAGSGVAVKFSLDGFQGLDVLAGTPTSTSVACANLRSASTNPIQANAKPSGPKLTYNADTDLYTFIWKTEKGWANSCREFVISFDDGTSYTANFQFKK